MKAIPIAVLCVLLAGGAFAIGRATAEAAPDSGRSRDVVVSVGDTVRVPAVDVLCGAHIEARQPRFLCGRTSPGTRFQVAFDPQRSVVVRVGDPGQIRVFPER